MEVIWTLKHLIHLGFLGLLETYPTFLVLVACHIRLDIVISGPRGCIYQSDFVIFAPVALNFCLDVLFLRQDIVIFSKILYFFNHSLLYYRANKVYARSPPFPLRPLDILRKEIINFALILQSLAI